jgi:predicted nucleic acid-binding protein
MKLCYDTNVIVDILGKTEDFHYSFAALDVAILREFQICIPITSTTDIAYILPRRKLASKQDTAELLGEFFAIVEILDARAVDALSALESDMPDYEDALLAHMACRNSVDLIITRNTKDFAHSPVPAMSPEQFVHIHKPHNVEYTSIQDVEG